MPTSLNFGEGDACTLESTQVTHICPAAHPAIPNTRLATDLRTALGEPLNFPPLASATVPGDRAVIALEYGVPQGRQCIAGALAALQDAGVERSLVTLLLSSEFSKHTKLCDDLKSLANDEEISLAIHNPDEKLATTLLGVTRSGRPLRLSRELCDADLVVSIGLCKLASSTEQAHPSFSSLFPLFSDRETIERYRAPIAADSKVINAERQNEINEAGWMLGAGLTVQIVPNPTGEVAALFAGEPATVAKEASAKYRQIWARSIDGCGDLIVATINGDTSQQTWQNVGRILEFTEPALDVGGVLVIWTEITDTPGGSLSRLAGNETIETIERELMRDRLPDSWPAMLLCRALQRGAVYLRSKLAPEVVESLGMAPLLESDELARLSRSHEHCIVLDGAHLLLPQFKAIAK